MNIFWFLFLCISITYVFVNGSIFRDFFEEICYIKDPTKERLVWIRLKLKELIFCYLCLGFWVGVLISWIESAYIPNVKFSIPCLYSGFLSSFSSFVIGNFVDRYIVEK